MQVGFCVQGSNEDLRFGLLGQSALGRLLSFKQAEFACTVLLGRLHYRSELLHALADQQIPLNMANDADLVLSAYRCWGPDALNRLEGCFALALWDAEKRRLYARRDLLGGFPLYWGHRGRRVAVGTNLQEVCEWISATVLDQESSVRRTASNVALIFNTCRGCASASASGLGVSIACPRIGSTISLNFAG